MDLSLVKIVVLGVLALIIFGPERLPQLAGQAGRMLRDLRALADRARADLQDNLGPEFSDFDLTDLNPRSFVRKHLFEDEPSITASSQLGLDDEPAPALLAGETPPYDVEAT